ncbi:hypothetical protein [Flavicella sediminum]|uniref:hypothetical protein n=1 Tax=Flavicella sediminum TaxID=2585141 RepID=UPI00111CF82C|nr:hypothetical protein [Flavicella sediminum]
MKKLLVVLFFVNGFISVNAQTIPLKVEKGDLLFADNFDKSEDDKTWTVHEKFTGAFSKVNGVWVTKEIAGAGHGSTARVHFDYKDVIIEFDFQFKGGTRFNIVMDDSDCKSVWAGHICRASFSKGGFMVQDDKTGTMDLNIRNQIKDNPKRKKELKAFLDAKKSFVKMKFEEGNWYHAVITKQGTVLECKVGDKIAQLKSEGIGHAKLNKFGPTITGADILFDNLSMWALKK